MNDVVDYRVVCGTDKSQGTALMLMVPRWLELGLDKTNVPLPSLANRPPRAGFPSGTAVTLMPATVNVPQSRVDAPGVSAGAEDRADGPIAVSVTDAPALKLRVKPAVFAAGGNDPPCQFEEVPNSHQP